MEGRSDLKWLKLHCLEGAIILEIGKYYQVPDQEE